MLPLRLQKNNIRIAQTADRNSHLEVLNKKDVLKNFAMLKSIAKFIGKYLFWSLLFNKIAGSGPATLLKRSLRHSCLEFCLTFKNTIFTKLLRAIASVMTNKLKMISISKVR